MKRIFVFGLLLSMSIVMSGCVRDTICAYYDFKLPSLEIYDNKTLLLMELDVESQIRHKNNHPAQWKVIMRKGIPYLQVEGGEGTLSGLYRLQFVYDSVESRLFLELTSDNLYLLACHSDTDNIGAPPSRTSSSTHGIGLLEQDYQEPVFQVIRPERQYLLKKAPYLVKISHGHITTFGHNPYDKCE